MNGRRSGSRPTIFRLQHHPWMACPLITRVEEIIPRLYSERASTYARRPRQRVRTSVVLVTTNFTLMTPKLVTTFSIRLKPTMRSAHSMRYMTSQNRVRPGENAAGVILGSGWFNQDKVWIEGKYRVPGGTNYGVPRVLLQFRFEYRDGAIETISTDESWKAASGPILKNNVYAGEVYDARLEIPGWSRPAFDDRAWKNACQIESPTRRLQAQSLPPIRRVRTLTPTNLSQPRPGVFVYDFGQNFAGWARLKLTAPRGIEIVLRFAESLSKDGMIDPASTGVFATGVVQTDTYVAKGSGWEVWEPRFTYHGFRYAEMTGFPGTPSLQNLEGVVVHSGVPRGGRIRMLGCHA